MEHSVLVVGAGLVGSRRARVAAGHRRTRLCGVCDVDPARAAALAGRHGGRAFADWRRALDELRPDLVVVCTPNRELAPVATAALAGGASVLVEKPFGRSAAEARAMLEAARRAGRVLKVGFNHRFHPALRRAHELAAGGALGALTFVRGCYGHGGRPGYEDEWRTDPEVAGGGELLDQGVHLVDLLCCLLGRPRRVHAELAALCWPVEPLEDNAFALLRFPAGQVAALHASWTQWQNRFAWQVYGTEGAVEVDGLGGSYGPPTLTLYRRRTDGAPARERETFEAADRSWELEWDDFTAALDRGTAPAGEAAEGLRVMEVVDALYRSAQEGGPVELPAA